LRSVFLIVLCASAGVAFATHASALALFLAAAALLAGAAAWLDGGPDSAKDARGGGRCGARPARADT